MALHPALLGESSPSAIEAIRKALDGLDAEPFPVGFDRLEDATLKPCKGLDAANAFQPALRRHIAASGFELPAYTFKLHLNLEYRNVSSRRRDIQPLSWLVEEILLIESVNGAARHIPHGSWNLKRRQGVFDFSCAA